MANYQPYEITGFHSCDKEVGVAVLFGIIDLKPSKNDWDWLSDGIYFWEQNPFRAIEYAKESSEGKQFNKKPIKTLFIIGANIELSNCLNLVEAKSLTILSEAYESYKILKSICGLMLPINKENNRALDCDVIRYVQQSRFEAGKAPFDTI